MRRSCWRAGCGPCGQVTQTCTRAAPDPARALLKGALRGARWTGWRKCQFPETRPGADGGGLILREPSVNAAMERRPARALALRGRHAARREPRCGADRCSIPSDFLRGHSPENSGANRAARARGHGKNHQRIQRRVRSALLDSGLAASRRPGMTAEGARQGGWPR